MMKIFLTNLGKYSEGILEGEWLELPATEEEIEACKQRIGISEEPDENGNYYEEWFITDYETDVDGLKIGEYDNLEELNELAEAVDGEENRAAVLIYYGYYKAADIRDNLDNVIYVCTPDFFESDEEAVGRYYAELSLQIPEEIEMYFDYEAYGRDIMINGSFWTAPDGSIYEMCA